jgi:hypothetical protein
MWFQQALSAVRLKSRRMDQHRQLLVDMRDTMNRNIILLPLTSIEFVLVFWLYGIGRTMRETVGFNTTATVSGFSLTLVFSLVFLFLLLLLATSLDVKLKRWRLILVLFLGSLILGSAMSETWILWDEARFRDEIVTRPDISRPYSRPRAWPNEVGSLVYVPTKGIHSTD